MVWELARQVAFHPFHRAADRNTVDHEAGKNGPILTLICPRKTRPFGTTLHALSEFVVGFAFDHVKPE